MRVLITGGGGFLGSHLVERVRRDGLEPFVPRGTGEEISIRELAELTGYDGEIVWDTTKPNVQPRRKLDVSRAEDLFGFRAGTSFRDGLERTIAWYRAPAAAPATR